MPRTTLSALAVAGVLALAPYAVADDATPTPEPTVALTPSRTPSAAPTSATPEPSVSLTPSRTPQPSSPVVTTSAGPRTTEATPSQTSSTPTPSLPPVTSTTVAPSATPATTDNAYGFEKITVWWVIQPGTAVQRLYTGPVAAGLTCQRDVYWSRPAEVAAVTADGLLHPGEDGGLWNAWDTTRPDGIGGVAPVACPAYLAATLTPAPSKTPTPATATIVWTPPAGTVLDPATGLPDERKHLAWPQTKGAPKCGPAQEDTYTAPSREQLDAFLADLGDTLELIDGRPEDEVRAPKYGVTYTWRWIDGKPCAAPTTAAPTTAAPTTSAPTTAAPTSAAPTTAAPAPSTSAPTTQAPSATVAPSTAAPSTLTPAPSSSAPAVVPSSSTPTRTASAPAYVGGDRLAATGASMVWPLGLAGLVLVTAGLALLRKGGAR